MRSTTETLIAALRILANDIETDDGVVNACLVEAADRLAELSRGECICTKCGLRQDAPNQPEPTF